jgi:hypothetical protein
MTLLIVPPLHAGTRPGAASASACSTTSALRVLVSTLPPETAAGRRGLSRHPSGANTSTGRKQPSFIGIVGSVTARNA